MMADDVTMTSHLQTFVNKDLQTEHSLISQHNFLYTIQAYTLPLPLNPIKNGIFVPIHHTVLC